MRPDPRKPRPVLVAENYKSEVTTITPKRIAALVCALFGRRLPYLGIEHFVDRKGVIKATRTLIQN